MEYKSFMAEGYSIGAHAESLYSRGYKHYGTMGQGNKQVHIFTPAKGKVDHHMLLKHDGADPVRHSGAPDLKAIKTMTEAVDVQAIQKERATKAQRKDKNIQTHNVKEDLPKNAKAGDYVDDFVHSKNKMFSGDSKKQRIKRALGAYYGQKNEDKTGLTVAVPVEVGGKRYSAVNGQAYVHSVTTMGRWNTQTRKMRKALKPGPHHDKIIAALEKHKAETYKSEEVIQELSKKTLGSYVKKAHANATDASYEAGEAANDDRSNSAYHYNKANRKVQKRAKGINRAADKLAKSEDLAEGWFTRSHPRIGNRSGSTHRVTVQHTKTGQKSTFDVTAPTNDHAIKHVINHLRTHPSVLKVTQIKHLYEGAAEDALAKQRASIEATAERLAAQKKENTKNITGPTKRILARVTKNHVWQPKTPDKPFRKKNIDTLIKNAQQKSKDGAKPMMIKSMKEWMELQEVSADLKNRYLDKAVDHQKKAFRKPADPKNLTPKGRLKKSWTDSDEYKNGQKKFEKRRSIIQKVSKEVRGKKHYSDLDEALEIRHAINHLDRQARHHARKYKEHQREMNSIANNPEHSHEQALKYSGHAEEAIWHHRQYKARLAQLDAGKNEDLQELSKGTLQAYLPRARGSRNAAANRREVADEKWEKANKAHRDGTAKTAHTGDYHRQTMKIQSSVSKAADRTIEKRTKGIAAARSRLAKEDLDEGLVSKVVNAAKNLNKRTQFPKDRIDGAEKRILKNYPKNTESKAKALKKIEMQRLRDLDRRSSDDSEMGGNSHLDRLAGRHMGIHAKLYGKESAARQLDKAMKKEDLDEAQDKKGVTVAIPVDIDGKKYSAVNGQAYVHARQTVGNGRWNTSQRTMRRPLKPGPVHDKVITALEKHKADRDAELEQWYKDNPHAQRHHIGEGLVSKITNAAKNINKRLKPAAVRIAQTREKVGYDNAKGKDLSPRGNALRKVEKIEWSKQNPVKKKKDIVPMGKLPDKVWEEQSSLDEGMFRKLAHSVAGKSIAKSRARASFRAADADEGAGEHKEKAGYAYQDIARGKGLKFGSRKEELEIRPGQKVLIKEKPKRGPDGKLSKSKAAQRVEDCIKMSGKKQKIDTEPSYNPLTTAGGGGGTPNA